MTVSTRNRTAAIIAVIGGILLLIGGSTGMAGFLRELSNIVQDLMGGENQAVATIFWILIIIATLGGLAVIIGGLLIYKNHIIIGKILITLGAGMGIIGLIISLISALAQGETIQFFSWLTTSFLGVGIILTLVARFMAKRDKEEDKKKKRK